MNPKEHFKFLTECKIYKVKDEDEFTRSYVSFLLQSLYKPYEGEEIFKLDLFRLRHFKINHTEPINWGSLRCVEAKKFADGTFLVTIDECAPDACPTLCEYIEKYMRSYGFEVRVVTEW